MQANTIPEAIALLPPYGDYMVFVDESGDHNLVSVNPDYPMWWLPVQRRAYRQAWWPLVCHGLRRGAGCTGSGSCPHQV